MAIRFGRPVIRFLTDLLYLPVGESPMELDDRVSGVADVIQQGWARRQMRFTSSNFSDTVIGAPDIAYCFLDDPAFVTTGYPEKAIVRQDINRVALVQWQPNIGAPTLVNNWANGEGSTVSFGVVLFRGSTFNGLTIPADGVVLRRMQVETSNRFRGWEPMGYHLDQGVSLWTANGGPTSPIFIPAGWGLGFYGMRSAGGNWVAANSFGMIRAAVLDVPREVKPY